MSFPHASSDAFDRLVELGALDVECSRSDGIEALMPDSVTPDHVAAALGTAARISTSSAVGRDADSVWVLVPREVRVGRVRIVPAHIDDADPSAVRLIDAPAFGTGLHPTTALCLEALDAAVASLRPEGVLDVGTGSGVLGLAALKLGVPRAVAIDVDAEAVRVATENGRLNGMAGRLRVAHGGPETLAGAWPVVMANVLAAPLIEMAPALVRRVSHEGRLVLSGIPRSVEDDVVRAYRHLGMRCVGARSRAGWSCILLQASW